MEKMLSEVCDIQYGYAFDSAKFSADQGIPLIRIRDVVRGFSETHTTEVCDQEYIVNDGDILIGMDGEFNIARWKGGKAYLNQRVCRLLPKDEVDAMYLYYFMPKALKAIEDKTPFVTVKHLSVKELNKIVVPIPIIEEQKEIANCLQRFDELISFRKQQLSKLDELVKSQFIEMFGSTILNPFGWKKDNLGAVCDVRDGTHDSPQYYETGYPLVTSKNVTGGKIDLTDCSLICEADYKKINERSKVDMGDIIMPMIGTVGKPVIVDIEPSFAIKNVSLIKFKADSRVLNIYIRALLQSDYFDDAILSKVRGGTQKFISLGDIRKLEVLVPPMELQEQFAVFVEQVDKSKLEIQRSLEKLETLKKALMQKYFG